MYYRDTIAQINLDAIEHNIQYIQRKTPKRLIAVLKANGYGHSDFYVAKSAMEMGCVMVAVSSLDEALALRKQGFLSQILILGHIRPCDIQTAINQNITIPIISLDWLKSVVSCNSDLNHLLFHIKIDTGMNRVGLKTTNEVLEAIELVQKHNGLIEGIFTHYACADEESKEMCDSQFEQFKTIVLDSHFDFKWIHCENSAAILSYDDNFTNAARLGLAMYGVSPIVGEYDLIPALTLKTHIVRIQEIKKGETVGYGATYTADEDCFIATLPIGYADGFLRANQGRYLYCQGEWLEVVGRVCMDQCMVKSSKKFDVGTTVEIISIHTPVTKMAKELNTIPYEVLCLLSDRIPRKIMKNNQQIALINARLREF